MSHHIRKHHLILGLLALCIAGAFLYSYGMLRVGNFGPPPSTPVMPSVGNDGCRPTGCSGEICDDGIVASPCIYRQEFECYRTAVCERQKDGSCGWTQTPELAACLASKKSAATPAPDGQGQPVNPVQPPGTQPPSTP